MTLDVTLRRRPDPIPPGTYVVVEVEDTGIGIPKHRQAWVLEPHATTRAESGNTGLGLAMVRDLARGCGGFLVLESAVGQFTRVGLYFPRL